MAELSPPVASQQQQQLRQRQRRGWYLYGWASHVFPTIVVTVFMGRYLTSVAENAVGKHGRLHLLGIPVAPGSLFVYLVSFGTVLLVLAMPLVGAVADRTGAKRELLLGFGWLAAACCVGLIAVSGSDWQLGSVLFLLGYLGYSCATVVNYALLIDVSAAADRDRVSSFGWAFAYIGGGILLAADFVLSLFLTDKAWLARISLCSAGLWWALFNVLPWRLLRGLDRTAAVLPALAHGGCGALRRLPAAAPNARRAAELSDHGGVPDRLPDLQRRHPDRHHGGRPVRRQAAAAVRQRAALGDPAGAVRGLRRSDLAGPAGRPVRSPAGGDRRAGSVGAAGGVRLLPHGRRGLAVLPAGGGHRGGARRQPGAVPVAVLPADPGRPGGRVLQPVRDQRLRHVLARSAAVRR